MQINKINDYNFNNKYNQNVSFEGIKIKNFIPRLNKIKQQDVIEETCDRFADMTGIKSSELLDLVKESNFIKFNFLKTLVSKYNGRNFNLAGNLKEDPQIMLDTFKIVEKPTLAHFNIIEKSDMPLKSIYEIFSVAKDKNSLQFVQKMQHDISGNSKESAKIITDMLKSDNQKEYLRNLQKYVSYIKLNLKNEKAIPELDELIQTGNYDRKVFDVKLAVNNIMKYGSIRGAMGANVKDIEQNYSVEGEKFLKSIFHDYLIRKKGLNADDCTNILNMYKTSTSDNIGLRLDIIDKFKFFVPDMKNTRTSELKAMIKLFDRIDKDENCAKFINDVLNKDNITISTIAELDRILDIVPAKKAAVFHKNIAQIVKYTNEEERIAALTNEVENPFFITPRYAELFEDSIAAGFAQKESRISKMARYIENKINIAKYKRISRAQGSESVSSIPSPTINVPTVSPVPATTTSIPVAPVKVQEAIAVITPQEHKIELQRTFKESREARKLRVQNDVNEIIKQKLGQKTLERQQEEYKNGAMVMRLKLLPEIFESIKHTRKMQKLSGKRPTVENKDAIRLYSRINGKNRKLVNYMLKQTDSSGERIYTIQDIIYELNLADQKIANLKAAKGKEFKAQDAKAIFAHEYEILFNEFGKLKRTNRKKAA